MPKSKAAVKDDRKTLIGKGTAHLRNSYTHQPTRDGLEIGSNKVYAAIHHFGGKTGRGLRVTLPPRPVMGMTPEHRNAIGDILIDEIRRAQA
jgi:phage gpG-like protein